MTRFIKPVLYILGGAALGGSISYFLAHREIKKLEETIMRLENNFVYFQMKYHPKEKTANEKIEREEVETTFPSNPVNKSIEKPDISELFHELVINPDMPIPKELLSDDPYLVAENSIDLEDDKYDSEVAYTYFADGILTDENDEIIVDPDDILPSGWRHCFGWNCRSDDTFFAINPKLRLLIEVGKADDEYNGVYHDDSWEE